MSISARDRLFAQRELIAYFDWLRQGRTLQNSALGYPTSTVEYALLRGCTGVSGISGSRVPNYFNLDRNVELLDRAIWRWPVKIKETLILHYLERMERKRIAAILGITDRQVGNRLSSGYKLALEVLQ